MPDHTYFNIPTMLTIREACAMSLSQQVAMMMPTGSMLITAMHEVSKILVVTRFNSALDIVSTIEFEQEFDGVKVLDCPVDVFVQHMLIELDTAMSIEDSKDETKH